MSRLMRFAGLLWLLLLAAEAAAVPRTYFMYFNTGTALTQPAVTTNIACPAAADTAMGATPGISLLADVQDATCVPAVNRDVTWTNANTLSLYYNGAGYASAMNVTGTSVGVRARGIVAGSILTANLFYTTPAGVKVYFAGTPGSVAVTAARADYTISLAGLSATMVPAGSKLGIEFSWVNATGMRLSVNQSTLNNQLIVDETAPPPTPTLTSINCAGACTTNAASVSWMVTFGTSVTGVNSGNFTLVNAGLGGAPAITSVTGSGTTWTVTASTGTGDGTLGLNMANTTGVSPAVANLPFAGQVHIIDRTAPAVSSIARNGASPTALASVSWTVTFSESVAGVDAADFALVQSGVSGAAITAVTGSGTTYTVTASTGTGTGALGLNLADNDSIIDAASNPLGGAGAGNGDFIGETYLIVTPLTVTASPTSCTNVADIGTQLWTTATPNDPLASDNLYATASVNDNQITNYLQCTGYGFTIPAGATINGITVYVERNASGTLVRDAAMRLVKDVAGLATIQATDRSTLTNYTTADVVEAHGGGADLWGGIWTAADINSINFGAALASTKAGAAGGARTVSVDHMSISVDYTSPFPAVISINLASADPTFPATEVSWVVTFSENVTGVDAADFALAQAGGVIGATITGVSGSGTTWTVTANTGAGSGTLGLNLADNDSIFNAGGLPLGGTGVGNGNFTGQVYTVLPAETGSFNACDVGTSCTGITPPTYLRTKVAGVAFSLDIVALNADGSRNTPYSNTVMVELLDSSDYSGAIDADGCRSTWPVIATLAPNPVFTAPNAGLLTVGPFNIANAYRDVRVRVTKVTGPPRRGCSTDNFAIRPQSLAVVSANANADGTGVNVSAAPAIKAGAGFSLTATALAGYNGTPQINALLVDAHAGAVATGTPAGGFAAADPASGAATGAAFTYSEVGYFRFQPYGVFDNSFTGVDQPGGCRATDSCDCAAAPNNFSNAAIGGRYGCDFGNTASTVYFGRFIPDHFDTAVVLSAGVPMPCPAGTCPASNDLQDGFAYSGQPFSVQVIARSLAGGTTQNYAGGYARAVTLTAWDAAGGATQNPSGSLANNALAAATFSAGAATTSAPVYTLAAVQTAPTDIFMRADEPAGADGVSSLRVASSVEGGVRVASGRVKIGNAHGSELLPLSLAVAVQFWNGTSWVTSSTDTTALVAGNVAISNCQRNLGKPPPTCKPAVAVGAVTLVNGAGSIRLDAPGEGNNGSADLTLSAGGWPGWLPSNTGRATFGVYKGSSEFIYLREVY